MAPSSVLAILGVLAAAVAVPISPPGSASKPATRLWQTAAGTRWNDGFLIGNGRIGASVMGGAKSELLYLNEDSFWDRTFLDRANPKALPNLERMRSLVLNGRPQDAWDVANANYLGVPTTSDANYNTIGTMSLEMQHAASVGSYERYLDVEDATSGVYYTVGGVAYFREYLASNPADVMVIRIVASEPGAVAFDVSLARANAAASTPANDTVLLRGTSGSSNAMSFASGAKVVTSGGTVSTARNAIQVRGADEAWVYVTAWTSFREQNQVNKVLADLQNATATRADYKTVRDAHVKDYQSLYSRCQLGIGSSNDRQRAMSTSQRVSAYRSAFDPELATLYFQFGRYLLISASRKGFLPANLQGIWNDNQNPMWGSRFTININLRKHHYLPVSR